MSEASEQQESVKPTWLEGFVPVPTKHGPDGRFVKGVSGNPQGRPLGQTKRQRLMQRMLDESDGILSSMLEKAKDGDVGAAGLILSRVSAPLKAAAGCVQFDFRTDVPLSEQAEAVVAAVASGAVDPETGRLLVSTLQAVSGIRAVEDLEQRIIQLEAKQIG